MSSVGIGIPKMLPITGTWTLPFAAYLMLLSNRVVLTRISSKKFLGDSIPKTAGSANDFDDLTINKSCHQNFIENVPLAFVLAAVAELNGANKKILNYTLGALLVARVLHAELGLRGKSDAVGIGRPIGYFGSNAILTGLATYSAYLVKGYWGF